MTSSVTAISFGSPLNAAQRNGPLPSQNNGRIYAGTNPGKSNAFCLDPAFPSLLPGYYFHNQM